jgi:hypothetical protein
MCNICGHARPGGLSPTRVQPDAVEATPSTAVVARFALLPRPMSENARGGSATDEERRVVLGRTRRERTRGRPAASPLSEVFAPRAPPASGLTMKSGSGLPTNCAMAIAFTRSEHVRKAYLSPSAATALAEKLREHNYANEPAKIEVLYLYIYIG